MPQDNVRSQRIAAIIFGAAALLFVLAMVIFGPDRLPPYNHGLVAFLSALLWALFGVFLVGNLKSSQRKGRPEWLQKVFKGVGGVFFFSIVFIWWYSEFSPIARIQGKAPIVPGTTAKTPKVVDLPQLTEDIRQMLSLEQHADTLRIVRIDPFREIVPPKEVRDYIGDLPEEVGPYASALRAIAARQFDEVARLLDSAEAGKDAEPVRLLEARGMAKFYEKKYPEAVEFLEKALALRPDVRELQIELATAYFFAQRSADAESLLRKILEADDASLGPDHEDIAVDLCRLSGVLQSLGKYDEAEPLLERALAIDEKASGVDHPNVARDLDGLAGIMQTQNRFTEAEPLLRRILEIDKGYYGPEDTRVARALNNLASVLNAQNRGSEAEPILRQALDIDEKALGSDHPVVATDLSNLGLLLFAGKRYEEAEPVLKRMLEIREKCFDSNHPEVARALTSIGALYQATGRYTEAEPMFRRALKIDESAYGPEHPQTAKDLLALALLYHSSDRSAEAEPLMRRALNIDEKVFGPDHPEVAVCLGNLGMLLQAGKRYDEAEPLMQKALNIDEKFWGPYQTQVAVRYGNLGRLLIEMGKTDDGKFALERALEIFTIRFNEYHPYVVETKRRLEEIGKKN